MSPRGAAKTAGAAASAAEAMGAVAERLEEAVVHTLTAAEALQAFVAALGEDDLEQIKRIEITPNRHRAVIFGTDNSARGVRIEPLPAPSSEDEE